jgi:hypothetical protein
LWKHSRSYQGGAITYSRKTIALAFTHIKKAKGAQVRQEQQSIDIVKNERLRLNTHTTKLADKTPSNPPQRSLTISARFRKGSTEYMHALVVFLVFRPRCSENMRKARPNVKHSEDAGGKKKREKKHILHAKHQKQRR